LFETQRVALGWYVVAPSGRQKATIPPFETEPKAEPDPIYLNGWTWEFVEIKLKEIASKLLG